MNKKDTDKFLDKSLENLYLELGQQLLGLSSLPTSKDTFIRAAQKWMIESRKVLAEKICRNATILAIVKSDQEQNKGILFASLADFLSSIITGVSPFTVSALLIKEGLDSLCKGLWIEKGKKRKKNK